MAANSTPEPTDRLAAIVASMVENDVLDRVAADEEDNDVYAFLASGESFDSQQLPASGSHGERTVYLVARKGPMARRLLKVTVEPLTE